MEQSMSTSKVTVEYFDPHGLYKLIAPGLDSRLPLRHLHWQSHSGPLRSIDTLHIELIAADTTQEVALEKTGKHESSAAAGDDGFHTASLGGRGGSAEDVTRNTSPLPRPATKERRHQIPGLRQTPYLKVLLVRCDSNDNYKSQTRTEIRDWVKEHTMPTGKKSGMAENHDAFEWMIVHVVIPNSAAYAQPRLSKQTDGSSSDSAAKTTSRWGKNSSTILEKLRSDFNGSNNGKVVDRVAQIRIGLNDVSYELLPRVVPAVPGTFVESEKDAQNAWADLLDKLKVLILSSFDIRVSQYEEDIREKDMQRTLPGWNFCTFFILKEGLARGFESVGLVEDALVGYDELSVGLDMIVKEQEINGDDEETHGGALLSFTDDLLEIALREASSVETEDASSVDDEEPVDLQSKDQGVSGSKISAYSGQIDEIPLSSTKKTYRELILANNVSVFDFRCYIFSRQMSLLLRLANVWLTREELLVRIKKQGESILHGVATHAPPQKKADESENLAMLAEICRRALEFIPAVSRVMREDIWHALSQNPDKKKGVTEASSKVPWAEVVDNMVASYAFSIAQQILAQTFSKSLPIPGGELKVSLGSGTTTRSTRSSSLHVQGHESTRGPPSPGIFPGPGAVNPHAEKNTHHSKLGLEGLAGRRADLYMLSRGILEQSGKRKDWFDGWASAPAISEPLANDMEDVNLDDDQDTSGKDAHVSKPEVSSDKFILAGTSNSLLRTALGDQYDFYRLYEMLTDKALRHYTIAGNAHSIHSNLADLAVLKYQLGDHIAAAAFFYEATPFFGEGSWSHLEISMLIMYVHCLKEMGRKDEYAWRLLKLLTKTAEAEKDRLAHRSSGGLNGVLGEWTLNMAVLHGYLKDFLDASLELPKEVHVPLTNFFCTFEVAGTPIYTERQDSFGISLRFYSLLPDELPVEKIRVHMVCTSSGEQPREIWLESKDPLLLQSGNGKFEVYSNTTTPGIYTIDEVRIVSSKVVISHERQSSSTDTATILKVPHVIVYQRTSALDVQVSMCKTLQLDKNNFLEIELLTGWNEIQRCELHIRAATGGLRLLMSEAKVIDSEHSFACPVQGGNVVFESISADDRVKITFPFSIEQDTLDLCIKIDVQYTTEHGVFKFSKTSAVSTALALGVNVQDVFKHNSLYSRFTVSTATKSPLWLLQSELMDSDLFSSGFGIPPENPPIVFPKQPASLLYQISRKANLELNKKLMKTMYIKLYYNLFEDEIAAQLESFLTEAFKRTDGLLYEFSKMAVSSVLQVVRSSLSASDLERAVLVGELSTAFIGDVNWSNRFPSIGSYGSTVDMGEQLSLVIKQWQANNTIISIPQFGPVLSKARIILIPVDIPSITIVHTADIRLQLPITPSPPEGGNNAATKSGRSKTIVSVNQLLSAMLHLRWTRKWDTEDIGAQTSSNSTEDLEFSFEVTAPADTWLIGGRRKGHFIIPVPDSTSGIGMSSTAESEAAIPLTLIPLREGWLPYPSVEIREVQPNEASASYSAAGQPPTDLMLGLRGRHHCEIDYRNLGETVCVVADRTRVTLSLDASGPGGGPLVLESERPGLASRLAV